MAGKHVEHSTRSGAHAAPACMSRTCAKALCIHWLLTVALCCNARLLICCNCQQSTEYETTLSFQLQTNRALPHSERTIFSCASVTFLNMVRYVSALVDDCAVRYEHVFIFFPHECRRRGFAQLLLLCAPSRRP